MAALNYAILYIVLFLAVKLVPAGSKAANAPAEEYWKSELPSTPLPKTLQDLLQPHGSTSDLVPSTEESHENEFSEGVGEGMDVDARRNYGRRYGTTEGLAEDGNADARRRYFHYNPTEEFAADGNVDARRRYRRHYSTPEGFAEDGNADARRRYFHYNPTEGFVEDGNADVRRRYFHYKPTEYKPTEGFVEDGNADVRRRYFHYKPTEGFAEDGNADARRGYRRHYSTTEGFAEDGNVDARRGYRRHYSTTEGFAEDGNADVRRIYRKHYSIDGKADAMSALSNTTIFYLYNDLFPGKKMILLFTNSGSKKARFLPRQVAESIPFSSDHLPDILNDFAIEPMSKAAHIIRETIEECEDPNMEDEDKYCATSLESLVDLNVKRLGKNVQVVSTERGEKQEYSVSSEVKRIGDKITVCHKERYPYAVYYCHEINGTEAYSVPLVDSNGVKVKAVTVCHTDTSAWSPEHMAFQVLKIKPGPPVCHFLASDTLVWVQTKDVGQSLTA